MENRAQRKHIRLKQYDYAEEGVYFIMFCTKNRAPLQSHIVGRGDLADKECGQFSSRAVGRGALTPPQVALTDIGKIVAEIIENTEKVYANITVDNYVIMPNHVHVLIRISEGNGGVRAHRPTVNEIIKGIKGLATRKIGFSIWQTGFYDHIIRDDEDYQIRFRYIEENPARWPQDEYYQEVTNERHH